MTKLKYYCTYLILLNMVISSESICLTQAEEQRGYFLSAFSGLQGPTAIGKKRQGKIQEAIAQLRDGTLTWHAQKQAIITLVRSGSASVPSLVEIVRDSNSTENWITQFFAVITLGMIGDPVAKAVPVLFDLPNHSNQSLEDILILSTIEALLFDQEAVSIPRELWEVTEALIRIGKPAIPYLMTVVRNRKKPLERRSYAAEIVAQIGHLSNKDISVLLSLFDDTCGGWGRPRIRGHDFELQESQERMRRALAHIGEPIVPQLENLSQDKEMTSRTREESLIILREIKEVSSIRVRLAQSTPGGVDKKDISSISDISELIVLLSNDEAGFFTTRLDAASALSKSEDAVARLLEFFADGVSQEMAGLIAYTLAKMGKNEASVRAIPYLVAVFKEEVFYYDEFSIPVHALAAYVLAEIGLPEPEIVSLLVNDPFLPGWVRNKIEGALIQAGTSVVTSLENIVSNRETLEWAKKQARKMLLKILGDPSKEVIIATQI